jgi:hypothetical protein
MLIKGRLSSSHRNQMWNHCSLKCIPRMSLKYQYFTTQSPATLIYLLHRGTSLNIPLRQESGSFAFATIQGQLISTFFYLWNQRLFPLFQNNFFYSRCVYIRLWCCRPTSAIIIMDALRQFSNSAPFSDMLHPHYWRLISMKEIFFAHYKTDHITEFFLGPSLRCGCHLHINLSSE